MTDVDLLERRGKAQRERAAWPDLYEAVRDALALGFLPDAYGGAEPPAVLRPPTKFAYPAGGLAAPHHFNGPVQGARFGVWCHRDGSPDDLRAEPIWIAGDWSTTQALFGFVYRTAGGLTLDEAWAACIAFAEHHRAHFVVPVWPREDGRPHPALPIAHWRELLAIETGGPAVTQGSLFDDAPARPPSRLAAAQRSIRERLARPDAAEIPDDPDFLLLIRFGPGEVYAVEDLIDLANQARRDRGVPPVPGAGR